MPTAHHTQQGGLTLIETLVALAVLSIVLGIAAPSMHGIHERWQVSQTAHAMASTLMLARSEALRQGGNIGLHRLTDCPEQFGTQDWSCGWLIYANLDTTATWNSKNDQLLHEVKLTGKVNIMLQGKGATNLQFDRYGMVSGLNAIGFVFSPAISGVSSSATRALCMTSGGRIRIVNDVECSK